jgi:Zn-dependent protease
MINMMNYLLNIVLECVGILLATTIFEFSKAFVSTKLGDVKPKQDGRLTLNPFKHFEPIGFLLFLFFGYGWGKPVVTSAIYYKDRDKGNILTYGLPVIIILALGELLYLASKLTPFPLLSVAISIAARSFIHLAVFNIIPVYPMSGSYVLKSLIGLNNAMKYAQYEKIVQIAVVFLLLVGYLSIPLNFVSSALIGW